jgi:hypothetical protein
MAEQKKSRKHDRARKSGQNAVYKAEHRHEKSHVRRIRRHISRYGRSTDANAALIRFSEQIGLKVLQSSQEFLKQAGRKEAA